MANIMTYTSHNSILLPEYRTKWERIWPTEKQNVIVSSLDSQSLVRSRVQRYSICDSSQFTKQVGFVNTVNTARVYNDQDQAYLWVVHNALEPCQSKLRIKKSPEVFTSTVFIHPSANK